MVGCRASLESTLLVSGRAREHEDAGPYAPDQDRERQPIVCPLVRMRGSRRMIARSESSPRATISTDAHRATACSVGMSMIGTPAWVAVPQPGAWPSARFTCRKKPGIVKTYSTRTLFVTMNGPEAPSSEATDT